LKDQTAAVWPFHQGAVSRNGYLHHECAVGGGSVLEVDAIHAEAAHVRDERIPSDRIEASGHAASAPPVTGSVQELLVDAHVAVFVGEVVHVMADAFGNRTCRLSAPYVDVQRREDISDEHRIQATPIPRIHRDGEGATIHRGIGVHERLGNMRAHNVVRR
jgi:hypothetical protein